METRLHKLHFIIGLKIKKYHFNDWNSDLEVELESRKSEEILQIFTEVISATFEDF